jgi:hypothetical protein
MGRFGAMPGTRIEVHRPLSPLAMVRSLETPHFQVVNILHRWDTLIFGKRERVHSTLDPKRLEDKFRLMRVCPRAPALSSGSRHDTEERRNEVARDVIFGISSSYCRPRDGLAYVHLVTAVSVDHF